MMKYTYTVHAYVDRPGSKIVSFYFEKEFKSLLRTFWYISKLRKAGPFKITLVCQKVKEDQKG